MGKHSNAASASDQVHPHLHLVTDPAESNPAIPSRKCKMPGCFYLKLTDRLLCRAHADEADKKFLSDETSKLAPKSNVGRCTNCGHKTLAPEYPLCVSCHKQQFAPPPAPHAVAPTKDQQVETEFRKMVEVAYERGGAKAVKIELLGLAKVKDTFSGQYSVLVGGKSYTFFSARVAAEVKAYKADAAKRAEAEHLAREQAAAEARKTAQAEAAKLEAPKSKKGKSDGKNGKGKGKK
ncbi:MAG: hypothetical protein WC750_03325 [Patescibacteria group bacterium]|jgi:hypothetical protein